MKIVVIQGGAGLLVQNAEVVMQIACETLRELHIEVEEIRLYKEKIPYYEGAIQNSVSKIMEKIRSAEGILLISSVHILGVSAVLKSLLEYGEHPTYQTAFDNIFVMSIAISDGLGERETVEYIGRAVSILGASEGGRLALTIKSGESIGEDSEIKEIIEKQIEDFYRIVRQNRRLPMSSEASAYRLVKNMPLQPRMSKPMSVEQPPVFFVPEQQEETQPVVTKSPETSNLPISQKDKGVKTSMPWMPPKEQPKIPVKSEPKVPSEVISVQSPSFEIFTERQVADIEELTQLFAKQLQPDDVIIEPNPSVYKRPTAKTPVSAPVPAVKTCRQMTQNLPHYFQPHLAGGISVIFQLKITGDEAVDGFISIQNGQCEFRDGEASQADITVLADCDIWIQVLKGKISAQKAFMTGQLKVRGNFIHLGKIDQLFKKM